MARFRILFLSFSVICLMLFAGLLRAGLSGEDREDLFRSLGILTEVVHLVENEYVDELNDQALAMALDAGLLESVDPWAAVVPEAEVEAYSHLASEPPAYGLFIGGRLGSAAVRCAIPGSPAAAANLQSWEVIEKIGDVYTRGRPLWQIRLDLAQREEAKQNVTLTVVDRHVDERREVVLDAVEWKIEPIVVSEQDGVQIIKLGALEAGVAAELAGVVEAGKPIVIDLRRLVWGFESEAVDVADIFIDDGLIGSRSERGAGEERFEATQDGIQGPSPIVLIGHETEGVGEILASALSRHGSPLVGWNSAGHAPHMRFVHSRGLHLWIPVGQWLRADGEPINGNGLEPSEEMEFFDDVGEDEDEAEDRVLARGIEMALEGAQTDETDEIALDEAA